MIKSFYKREPRRKTFFSSDIEVRSLALGEDILTELCEWERRFVSRSAGGARYSISVEGNIHGKIPDFITKRTTAPSDNLPTLILDGVRLSTTRDGILTVGERRSDVHLGTELKAWAIMSVEHLGSIKNMLFVIGKAHGATESSLSMYEIDKYMNLSFAKKSVEIAPTYDTDSYINCLGKHIFIVHNSKLDYIYYNINKDELETVAIGRDGKNEDYPPCTLVDRSVVADMAGRVFWLSGGRVYGIRVGYPRDVMRLDTPERESVIGMRCDRENLYIFRKDKNTRKITAYKYSDTQDGSFGGRAVEPTSLPQGLGFSG